MRIHPSLALRESEASLWHSATFALNIGVPVLWALQRGDLASSVVGGIAGMMLSLADKGGPLRERLSLLLRTVLAVLVLGTAGRLLAPHAALFWAAFLTLALGTARLSLAGSSVAATLRLGTLALIAMAGAPHAGASTVAALLVAALVAAATRTVGANFFPDAEALLPAPAPVEEEEAKLFGPRFCLAYAGAAGAALLVGGYQGVSHPMWIATTVLLVMQPEPRSSYERILQRVLGTLVGVVLAAIAIALLHSVQVLVACVLVIALLVPHGISRNYWLQSALISMLVLVMYDLAASGRGFDPALLAERVADVMLGCFLALIGTLAAFASPRRAR